MSGVPIEFIQQLDNFVLVAIVGIAAVFIVSVGSTYIFRWLARTLTGVTKEGLRVVFRLPIVGTTVIIGAWATIETAPVPTWVTTYAASTGLTLVAVLWAFSLIRFGNRILEPKVAANVDEEIAPIVENVWAVVVLVGTAFVSLDAWGIDITPLLASAGAAGIVVGFTARETLENFFASLSLYADRTYQTGDYIVVNDEEAQGYVVDVTVRSTRLRTLDGDTMVIPNSQLNRATIRNKSEPQLVHRIDIQIGVSYEADPKRIRTILHGVLENDEEVNEQPEPQVHIREFGDSAVIMELRAWISDPSRAAPIEDRLNQNSFDALVEAGIDVPYPKRDVRLWSMDE